MPFAYYDRLSPARQAIYRRSDAIVVLPLPAGIEVARPVLAIGDGLARGHRPTVQSGSQALVDALVDGFTVPQVDVRVLAVRPSDIEGELHGLYEPVDELPRARISVWMKTAQKKQVVAFRSFVRTLVHEMLHHLDYEHFGLEETFHTEGFYKRESSLSNAIFAAAGIPPPEPKSPRMG
ncbi:MAG: hypothetical protein U1F54_10870 [Burkholderiales bacterium]